MAAAQGQVGDTQDDKPARTSRETGASGPELVVLSREDAEHYEPSPKEICISIADPDAEPADVSTKFDAVLRLHFDDITEPYAPTDILFAADQARAISDFLDKWPGAERVIVHCNMGVSRSPGVALGICDARGWATAAFERSYPSWNPLVRNLVRQAATTTPRRST